MDALPRLILRQQPGASRGRAAFHHTTTGHTMHRHHEPPSFLLGMFCIGLMMFAVPAAWFIGAWLLGLG